jgi:NADH-quinone oxidoreductase subunit N
MDATDIYTLVLGATLGMCLMASANHLLMVFLAVEMASVPSYVLAGMLRGNRFSSEAALKYSVYGAGTAGVMLYGISLIAGVTGTVHLPSIAQKLAELDVAQLAQAGRGELLALVFGGLMLSVGLAFKLSAVPFHFWCPDVFEGAAAEVGAFLSVASKAAALALLVRVAVGLSTIVPMDPHEKTFVPGSRSAPAEKTEQLAWYRVDDEVAHEPQSPPAASHSPHSAPSSPEAANQRLEPVRRFAAKFIALLAVITCTFGNLAAYGQTNMKRLLAYSTIAHAGYMMMGVPAAVALAGVSSQGAEAAVAGVALYMFVYLFMNLGAFAVVAILRNAMQSEEIADYAGLIRRLPVTVVCLTIMLFSLIGLPPLAGFIGKFAVFAGLAQAYMSTGAFYLLVVLVIGALNTFLSLFYYVRVIKCMTFDPEPDTRGPVRLPILCSAFVIVLTVPLVVLIFGWTDIWNASLEAARFLF